MGALRPTPPSGWGNERQETLELPSGNVATLRKVNVRALMRAGAWRDELVEAFIQAQVGILGDADLALELEDEMVAAAFVSPKAVAKKRKQMPKGAIYVSQIDDEDFRFVLEWAYGGASDAARFRGDGAGGDDAGADGADVGDAAERDDGDGAR